MTQEEERERVLWAAGLVGRHAEWSFNTFPVLGENVAMFRAAKAWVMSRMPGLVMFGAAGRGKTGLAVSIVARMAGKVGAPGRWQVLTHPKRYEKFLEEGAVSWQPAPVYFTSWQGILDRMQLAAREKVGDDVRVREQLAEVDVLALDDVDVGTVSTFREAVLKDLVDRVNHRKRLVVTMNRHPSDLVEVLGERVVDRLCDRRMFTCVGALGGSLRQGQASGPAQVPWGG